MTATVIQHPAGTARPLLSMPGWFTVDLGDTAPVLAPNRQQALDLLDTRAQLKAARR